MSNAKTLLQLAGADLTPARTSDAALILIDMQTEYLDGPIAVEGASAAIARAKQLLAEARTQGAPVIHVAHKGRSGGLFDREAPRGQIIDALAALPTEVTIEKGLPNAFAGTELQANLARLGHKNLVIIGFMTHMCVSSTARAALDLGYRVTIDAAACATRDLPDGQGSVIHAALLHRVALVELSDRFAVIRYPDPV